MISIFSGSPYFNDWLQKTSKKVANCSKSIAVQTFIEIHNYFCKKEYCSKCCLIRKNCNTETNRDIAINIGTNFNFSTIINLFKNIAIFFAIYCDPSLDVATCPVRNIRWWTCTVLYRYGLSHIRVVLERFISFPGRT